VAERRYQQTVRDLGYAEADAQGWISVVMFRLRNQVAELGTKKVKVMGSEAEKSVKVSKVGQLWAEQFSADTVSPIGGPNSLLVAVSIGYDLATIG
jgi:hypothetical protein